MFLSRLLTPIATAALVATFVCPTVRAQATGDRVAQPVGMRYTIAFPNRLHHEAEVAVWVGRQLSRASAEEAAGAIGAWTVLNDVTARDLQRADKGRFTRAKGFDTFCPVADARLEALDWPAARIQCWVDGERRQDGALADLLFSPAELLAAVSQCMTLEPGDLVSLGTPAGVGPLRAGQTVEVRLVDDSGKTLLSLTNPVIAD